MAEMTTTNRKAEITAEPGKQEITIRRVFDAPRELVFRAHLDADAIRQWWGPAKYKNIIDKLEARSGGAWRFVQADTDGSEYGFHGVFHDVTSPERIVQTFEFEGMPGHVSLETATFEEQDGKTLRRSAVFFNRSKIGTECCSREWKAA